MSKQQSSLTSFFGGGAGGGGGSAKKSKQQAKLNFGSKAGSSGRKGDTTAPSDDKAVATGSAGAAATTANEAKENVGNAPPPVPVDESADTKPKSASGGKSNKDENALMDTDDEHVDNINEEQAKVKAEAENSKSPASKRAVDLVKPSSSSKKRRVIDDDEDDEDESVDDEEDADNEDMDQEKEQDSAKAEVKRTESHKKPNKEEEGEEEEEFKPSKDEDEEEDDDLMEDSDDEEEREDVKATTAITKNTNKKSINQVLKSSSSSRSSSKSSGKKKSDTLAKGMLSNDQLLSPKHDPNPWPTSTSVPYSALCATFAQIESISGRLEIQQSLTELFRKTLLRNGTDMYDLIYLASNTVAPAYECIELGVGDSILIKAIGEASGTNPGA